MKTKVFLLSISLLVAAGAYASDNTIKGNKKVTTRAISINDYDEISIAGSMTFEYEQSDAAPFLNITTDENLFEYIRAEVKDRKLIIGPKAREFSGSSYNLQPSVFKIKSNSRGLEKLNSAGSGSFIVLSPLRVGKLDINLAGSGSVELKKELTGEEVKINTAGSGSVEASGVITVKAISLHVAGSGEVNVDNINVETLQCNTAGSGSVRIEGRAREASYNVAGSGSIRAFGCKAGRVNVSQIGSGRIEVFAEDELTASKMGSGSISYKGNPSAVKKTPDRSRSIRQVQ
ncbi:MAG: DUF2807 domain-containing protein [Tannerellaceae bacterium]|jgi:hypothetical protein|nr:DUF2807 domain-containing protein [Tannerellaceae bacterium]